MVTVIIKADNVTAWRDGFGALVLQDFSQEVLVEIVGTPDELRALKVRLIEALEKREW